MVRLTKFSIYFLSYFFLIDYLPIMKKIMNMYKSNTKCNSNFPFKNEPNFIIFK